MHSFPGHGETRLEQRTLVGLILRDDPHRHRLQTLEARGGLEIRALLAAMQSRTALRALALEVDIGKQRRGTIEHRAAVTDCTMRGSRGPVTSRGGRGPWGLGRSSRRSPLEKSRLLES